MITLPTKRINRTINPTNRVTTTTPRNSIIQNFLYQKRERSQFSRVIQIVARRKPHGALFKLKDLSANIRSPEDRINLDLLLRISTKMWIILWINVSLGCENQTRSDLEQTA
jgi:hypothetical protein